MFLYKIIVINVAFANVLVMKNIRQIKTKITQYCTVKF